MRRVAELEAERRHMLEMELRQSGLLRSLDRQVRPVDLGAPTLRPALAAD
jgi:hypothetical protein